MIDTSTALHAKLDQEMPHFFQVLEATMSDSKPASDKSTRNPASARATSHHELGDDELARVAGGVLGPPVSPTKPPPPPEQITVRVPQQKRLKPQ